MSDELKNEKILFRVAPIDLGLAALFSNEARQAVIDAASISKGLAAMAQSEVDVVSIATGFAKMVRDVVAGMENLGQAMRSIMGEQGYENMLMSRAIAGRYLRLEFETKASPQFVESPDVVM